MEKGAKIMYIIGKVFSIINLVLVCLGIVCGILAMNKAQMIYELQPEAFESIEYIQMIGKTLLFACIFSVIMYIVLIMLISKAKRALDEGSSKQGIHIAMIVIGALSFDIFFLLGGIFALVAIGNKKSAAQISDNNIIIEEKEETESN